MKEFIKKHEFLKKIIKTVINFIKLPVLIPIGVLMNIRKIRETPRMELTDSIGVLGRGVSLKEAHRLNFLKDFIIVNTRPIELKTEPVKSLLKNKRIIHMINIGEGVLPAWYLLKYRIYKYIIARLKPNSSARDLYSPRKVYATEKFGFKTDLLPEEIIPYLEGAGNSGVIAIAYAATALKKKNVYISGVDFYETPYLTGPLNPDERELATKARDLMISYVSKLASRCPETNFYFITASSFNPKLPNVKIWRIEK